MWVFGQAPAVADEYDPFAEGFQWADLLGPLDPWTTLPGMDIPQREKDIVRPPFPGWNTWSTRGQDTTDHFEDGSQQ